MVEVELPDGSSRSYDAAVTPADVAEELSGSLASAAIAAELDGEPVDLSLAIAQGRHRLRILTDRDEQSLVILRHTTAHVMAQAVRRLYGDHVQYTIGPALSEDFQYGFYYDFDLPDGVGQEQLEDIEREMRRIVAEKIPIRRAELTPDQAKARFAELGQDYKVEMIDELVRRENVSSVSIYEQGDFVDLCRGPHLPHTGKLGAFKLQAVAGAYWRGDESRKMLTRVYGSAFFDAKSLRAHLERVEQARLRDHRALGKQLGLFLISDAVGPGLPLWLPRGETVRHELQSWLRSELIRRGYRMVFTPHIGRLDLYRRSGHYPYYKESQFPPIVMGHDSAGQETGYLLKPMNCPHHVQIYKSAQRSHRDLPLRLAEFGSVYRMEQSGELSGLIRARGFTQDDAHIFCAPDQLNAEIHSCVDLVKLVLGTLELNDYRVRIGLRDPDSTKYVGEPDVWRRAEENIRSVVAELGMNSSEEPGEAAFYGPKIDFIVKDCLGREWQLGTIQVDYNVPERFELEYIGPDNAAHRPVMIHRAPFGSLERFIGILIEHFGGAFPLWLAPVQISVLPVSEKFNDFGRRVASAATEAGMRAELDGSPEKIGAKIRRWTLQKVPYLLVVGQREAEAGTVSVRARGRGEIGSFPLGEVLDRLAEEAASRAARSVFSRDEE